jgi:hypothetical protein
LGYYAFQLPAWFQKMSAAAMFAVELGMPFLIFAPRRVRLLPCAAFLALQGVIFLTGNYCFFNLLTIGLCLLLLDDASLRRLLTLLPFSRKWLPEPNSSVHLQPGQSDPADGPSRGNAWRWPGLAAVPLAGVVLLTSLVQFVGLFRWSVSWPTPVAVVYDWVSPFRSFNSYGLFAVMTTSRPEIIVQGSNDGATWRDYGFKYKPGDVNRRPAFVEPHQPRLDWQMWFAALGDYRQNPWFINFCVRLLEGSPAVLALLDHNPFPDRPPRYIRATVYDYHFAPRSVHEKTGAWWQREEKGEYLPAISLRRSGP